VITNTLEAQEKMRENLKGVDLVMMLATTLHSIATGNMLPSWVKTICVDVNPAVVSKLMDRGTQQAIGIVSDVGGFLPLLVHYIKVENKEG
ncbi:MAG: ornithine cyclodeaminase family domain, partial [Candidatus Odinarchaeia archaeon]